jgi:metal-responsive CopG/Arc/MetJ family transcriptional regulator
MENAHSNDRVGVERFSVSLPSPQNDALNTISRETGMSKNELIRHALALLTTSVEARKKGLDLALSKDDRFVGRIVSTV